MDSGGGGTDSGGGGTDSGGGGTCPPLTVPPPTMPGCAAATLTCLMSAMTADAQQACIDGDPDPSGCNGCLNGEIIACASNNGCAQQIGDLECCAQDNCASAPDQNACIMSMCATQGDTFVTCVNGTVSSRACGISNLCFAAGGGFLPDFGGEHVDWRDVSSLVVALDPYGFLRR